MSRGASENSAKAAVVSCPAPSTDLLENESWSQKFQSVYTRAQPQPKETRKNTVHGAVASGTESPACKSMTSAFLLAAQTSGAEGECHRYSGTSARANGRVVHGSPGALHDQTLLRPVSLASLPNILFIARPVLACCFDSSCSALARTSSLNLIIAPVVPRVLPLRATVLPRARTRANTQHGPLPGGRADRGASCDRPERGVICEYFLARPSALQLQQHPNEEFGSGASASSFSVLHFLADAARGIDCKAPPEHSGPCTDVAATARLFDLSVGKGSTGCHRAGASIRP